MVFFVKLSWDEKFSPVKNLARVRAASGVEAATRDEYREKHGHDYTARICHQLWEAPQINWDGKILGCCRNFWGEFGGNAFSDGLLAGINSETLQYARRMLQGAAPVRDDIPCTTCDIYLHRRRDADWVDANSLRPAGVAVERG
jgi:hypothetical protein